MCRRLSEVNWKRLIGWTVWVMFAFILPAVFLFFVISFRLYVRGRLPDEAISFLTSDGVAEQLDKTGVGWIVEAVDLYSWTPLAIALTITFVVACFVLTIFWSGR